MVLIHARPDPADKTGISEREELSGACICATGGERDSQRAEKRKKNNTR